MIIIIIITFFFHYKLTTPYLFVCREGVPLLDTENFTVLIKNNVQFPKFKESKYENSCVRNLKILTKNFCKGILHVFTLSSSVIFLIYDFVKNFFTFLGG